MSTNAIDIEQRRDQEIFPVRLVVRDYECDQGQGVGNAVYLNYLEHCRWEYVRRYLKWNVEELAAQNIGFVVSRVEVDFRRSLVACDEVVVETEMRRTGTCRFHFLQKIYLMHGNERATTKPVLVANVILVAINTVTLRPETPEILEKLLHGFPIVESITTT